MRLARNASDQFLTQSERVLGWGIASALFAMMLLTFCDVIGRKFIGSSIPGVVEITELLMLGVIFLGMPLCSIKSEHVIFDLLDKFLPSFLAGLQHRFSHLCCALLLGGGFWLVWERAARTMTQGDQTSSLQIPLGPFYYCTAAMLFLTALVHLVLAFKPTKLEDDSSISGGAL